MARRAAAPNFPRRRGASQGVAALEGVAAAAAALAPRVAGALGDACGAGGGLAGPRRGSGEGRGWPLGLAAQGWGGFCADLAKNMGGVLP